MGTGMGLAGILMISLGFSSLRQRIRWGGDLVIALLAVLVPAYWLTTIYTGYGRLSLAGTGFAVFAAWNIMRPMRLQKVILLLALPGLLIYMGESRRELQNKDPRRETQEAGVGVGLESMYDPIETLTQITVEHRTSRAGGRWTPIRRHVRQHPAPADSTRLVAGQAQGVRRRAHRGAPAEHGRRRPFHGLAVPRGVVHELRLAGAAHDALCHRMVPGALRRMAPRASSVRALPTLTRGTPPSRCCAS